MPIDLPLHDAEFVVVDLETTGLKAGRDQIVEIGAVRVRGGEALGEFSELVDPGVPLPEFIVELTGLTDADLEGRPQLGTILPRFLDFAAGAVWVAHNAPFDVGFLRTSCEELGLEWPRPATVDTLQLARELIPKHVVGSRGLDSLCRHFGIRRERAHRALDDARATVDVLHALIERLGGHDVDTVEGVRSFRSDVDPRIRDKRRLIDGVRHRPGVYVFRGAGGDPLYIGTAGDLRRRLNQYFNGSDPRRRIHEMVLLAESVDVVECAHELEANVREARMLASLRPPYNRRSTEPGRGWYLVPSPRAEGGARASRSPAAPAGAVGPFRTRADALGARGIIADVAGGSFAEAAAALDSGGAELLGSLVEHVGALAAAGRYRRAAHDRDVVASLISATARRQRLAALAAVPRLQAARWDGEGGWDLAVIGHGRLVAAGRAPRGANAAHVATLLADNAAAVVPDDAPLRGANPHELMVLHRWLLRDDVRTGPVDGGVPWAEPVDAAARWLPWAGRAGAARDEAREAERDADRAARGSTRGAGRATASASSTGDAPGGSPEPGAAELPFGD
ncbi:DEDD exonuclease domain-containing protein [Corynebacterium sp. 335C]